MCMRDGGERIAFGHARGLRTMCSICAWTLSNLGAGPTSPGLHLKVAPYFEVGPYGIRGGLENTKGARPAGSRVRPSDLASRRRSWTFIPRTDCERIGSPWPHRS